MKAVSSFSAVACCLLGEDQCIPVSAGGVLAARRHGRALTKQGQIAAPGARRGWRGRCQVLSDPTRCSVSHGSRRRQTVWLHDQKLYG